MCRSHIKNCYFIYKQVEALGWVHDFLSVWSAYSSFRPRPHKILGIITLYGKNLFSIQLQWHSYVGRIKMKAIFDLLSYIGYLNLNNHLFLQKKKLFPQNFQKHWISGELDKSISPLKYPNKQILGQSYRNYKTDRNLTGFTVTLSKK